MTEAVPSHDLAPEVLIADQSTPVLLIADAPNRAERKVLQACLDRARRARTAEAKVEHVFLDLHGAVKESALGLLETKLDTADDTLVVPLRVVWSISGFRVRRARGQTAGGGYTLALHHLLFGDPRQPGGLRARWLLFRDPGRARCVAGTGATVGELRQRFAAGQPRASSNAPRAFAAFVARQAALTLELAEWSQIGRRYKAPRFVAETVHASPAYRSALAELAARTGRDVEELGHEAAGYMKEMIATPSPLFIDLTVRLDNLMLRLGYNGNITCREQDLERLRDIVQSRPALLLFTHKTYMDGPAVTSTLFARDFPMLHFFGGINMSFAVLGLLLRRSGGIFIRRSFRDKPLYKLVLRHYIGFLLEKRFPMTWAFEGTRSRTGKLMPPRYGLLKYVLEAAQATGARDIHVIPVTVSYDLMRDVEEYASEQTGRVKKPESLKWFVGYLSSLRRPMGRMYLNFGEPLVLEQPPDPEDGLALSKILFEVAVRANRVTPVTLPAVCCMVLLGAAPRGLTLEELQRETVQLVQWALKHGVFASSDFSPRRTAYVEGLVEAMVSMGLWVRFEEGSQPVFGIEPAEHPAASYYRNTIVHHFVNKAILELGLMRAAEADGADALGEFWAEVERLRDYFKFEFFYPDKAEFIGQLEQEMRRVDGAWEDRLRGGESGALELLREMAPLVAHASLRQFAESYSVVFDLLARLPASEGLEEGACISQALREGKQAYLQRRISSEASIGKILFANAYRLAANLGLTEGQAEGQSGPGGEEMQAGRVRLHREFQDLKRRLEHIRLMAWPSD